MLWYAPRGPGLLDYLGIWANMFLFCSHLFQGHSDGGGYRYLYPPKSAQVNFLWGKNNVRTAIQQFYTPKKLLYPQNKFLATPLICLFTDEEDWHKCCMLGANVDFTDSSARTALYRACLNDQESLVKLLLQYRANPNQSVFTQNMYSA